MNQVQETLNDPFTAGLRSVMSQRGIKPAPLAEMSGLGNSAVRDLFRRGSSPRISSAMAIASSLGMTIDEIISIGRGADAPVRIEHGEPAPEGRELVKVFDVSVSAGFGALAESEDHVYNMAFDRMFLSAITTALPSELCLLKVQGHSMEPTLLDDDQVLVDRSKTNLSYDGLFVLRFDDALHVKRIGRSTKAGHVMVISDHPSYPSLDIAKADLTVIGRVLWYGRKV